MGTDLKRRNFLRISALGAAGTILFPSVLSAEERKIIPLEKNSSVEKETGEYRFKLAMAGYTFVHFDLDTCLDFMQKLDVRFLCIKDFHLPLNSTDEQIAAFHAKCRAHNVTGYAVGPIYMKSEEQVDRAFEYAKRVGVTMVVGVPDYNLLDYVEQKVREYDFRLAIHLHGPDMPLYPDAADIWKNVKDRDARMGMCLDIGHNLRYGSDSLSDLKRYSSRVFDIHLKDVTGNTKKDGSVEVGRGVINMPEFVRLLRKTGYSGCVSLEYEKDMKNPFNGISESIGYFRGVMDAVR